MAKRILSSELMSLIALFQAVTRADVRDCFVDETSSILTYVVEENNLGKALGKKAVNIKKLEQKLNRKIKVVEFKPEVKSFIKSFLFPLKVSDVSDDNGIIKIIPADIKSRGMIIGRNASNLRNLEKVVQRFFKIEEIKVESPQ